MEKSIARQMRVSDLSRLTGHSALCHAVCGLTEEAGEVAGLLKREVFRGNEVSLERWAEELGDVLWYLIAVAREKGLTLDEIFMYNQKKCTERYGEF
jgi:NTP pyrophosphatase (non-canonical NTP hydrolase)